MLLSMQRTTSPTESSQTPLRKTRSEGALWQQAQSRKGRCEPTVNKNIPNKVPRRRKGEASFANRLCPLLEDRRVNRPLQRECFRGSVGREPTRTTCPTRAYSEKDGGRGLAGPLPVHGGTVTRERRTSNRANKAVNAAHLVVVASKV